MAYYTAVNNLVGFLFIPFIMVHCETIRFASSIPLSNTTRVAHLSHTLQKVSNILQLLPPDLLPDVVNEECKEHLQIFLNGVKNMEPWALRMFDSSSKLPDSIFTGNVFQLGDFGECIVQSNPEGLFTGKFCLPKFIPDPDLNIYDLLNFVNFSDSKIQYVKGNTTTIPFMALGICIPSSCMVDDLREILNNIIAQFEIPLVPVFDERDCSTNETESLDVGDWITTGILSVIAIIITISTFFDIFNNYSGKWRGLIVSFSIYTNGRKLFNLESDTSLSTLNGIRFLSMFWILLGHIYILTISESKNIIEASKDALTWDKIIITNAFVAVDTFLLLTGLLISYVFLNYMENKQLSDFNIFGYYFHRYLRITPAFGIMILIHATIIKHFGSGPMWKPALDAIAEPCRKNWWKNILYIQNYYYSACIELSWYLAVDMQLFLLSPILLIPLWKQPNYTLTVLVSLVVAGIVAVFLIAYMNEEHFILVELIRSIPENTKNFALEQFHQLGIIETYVKTHARFPPWIVGIILGFIIYKYSKKDVRLSKATILCGWILAIVLVAASLCFAYPLIQLNYEYNAIESSIYMAVHRVTWSVGVSWIIFACVSGYGGVINKLLSLKIWIPLSRLTYCTYLTQYTVLLLHYSTLKTLYHYNITEYFLKLVSLSVSCLIAALFLSLMFEAPFISTSNFFLKGIKKPTTLEKKNQEYQHKNLTLEHSD